MPKRKSVDAGKLVKMVQDEIPQAEIMKKMGFKTSTQLKNCLHERADCREGEGACDYRRARRQEG